MNNTDIIDLEIEEQIQFSKKLNRINYRIIKRLFDIVFSLVGLVFLIPVFVIVKLTYMLTGDFHKVILVQDRIGKNGKVFKFYKFRSMVPNADEILFRTLETDRILAEEYKENKKLKKDPRITKVGRIIRKTSIDELPQLLNIFLGDMTFIGNRPYLPREEEDMGEFYDDIVKTKPGLTGYWQVNGRSDVNFRKRLELEQYYSNHCGLKMDIKIFFKTFKVVLFGNDAR